VGRAALDEDAIRLIEEHNPDVEFDWTRILKGQETPEPKPEPERRQNRPQRQQREAPTAPKGPATPFAAAVSPVPAAEEMVPGTEVVRQVEGEEPEFPTVLSPDEPESAALSRLGPEGLLRLRARHAEVLARISEKITDPVRRDELKSQAERLNPDTWVTDADVTAGLEQYETVFEALRSVVGRRRKRRKRRSGGGGEQPRAAQAPAAADEDGPGEGEPGGEPEENL
jgi:hypothetical protein